MQIKNIADILHYITVVTHISKKFYTQIKDIAYILPDGIQFGIDVSNQELIVVETYTSFNHNNT